MRRAVPFALLLLVTACQREPDFDERYAKVARELREKGIAIDAELASQAANAPVSVSPGPAPASSLAAR